MYYLSLRTVWGQPLTRLSFSLCFDFREMSSTSPVAEPSTNLATRPDAPKLPEDEIGSQATYKVYKPSSISSPAPPREYSQFCNPLIFENDFGPPVPAPLPDEYFDPTTADLKAAQSTLAARTQALVNAPLELRSVREARDQAKRDRWPNVSDYCLRVMFKSQGKQTTIRIRFTDRTQLERTFPSTDKIRSVYAFVRNSLREDVKPIKFILCMTLVLVNGL